MCHNYITFPEFSSTITDHEGIRTDAQIIEEYNELLIKEIVPIELRHFKLGQRNYQHVVASPSKLLAV